jgi:hypothetical protein
MERVVSINGLEVAYSDAGHGNVPLILLHGLCSMIYTWKEVFGSPAQHTRAIAIDMAGFGATAKPHDETIYTIEAQARLVLAFMDRLGLDRAILCGNSMGGSVAFALRSWLSTSAPDPSCTCGLWRSLALPICTADQRTGETIRQSFGSPACHVMKSRRMLGSRMNLI